MWNRASDVNGRTSVAGFDIRERYLQELCKRWGGGTIRLEQIAQRRYMFCCLHCEFKRRMAWAWNVARTEDDKNSYKW